MPVIRGSFTKTNDLILPYRISMLSRVGKGFRHFPSIEKNNGKLLHDFMK